MENKSMSKIGFFITLGWLVFIAAYWGYYLPVIIDLRPSLYSIPALKNIGAELNYIWYRFAQILLFASVSIVGLHYLVNKNSPN